MMTSQDSVNSLQQRLEKSLDGLTRQAGQELKQMVMDLDVLQSDQRSKVVIQVLASHFEAATTNTK